MFEHLFNIKKNKASLKVYVFEIIFFIAKYSVKIRNSKMFSLPKM